MGVVAGGAESGGGGWGGGTKKKRGRRESGRKEREQRDGEVRGERGRVLVGGGGGGIKREREILWSIYPVRTCDDVSDLLARNHTAHFALGAAGNSLWRFVPRIYFDISRAYDRSWRCGLWCRGSGLACGDWQKNDQKKLGLVIELCTPPPPPPTHTHTLVHRPTSCKAHHTPDQSRQNCGRVTLVQLDPVLSLYGRVLGVINLAA